MTLQINPKNSGFRELKYEEIMAVSGGQERYSEIPLTEDEFTWTVNGVEMVDNDGDGIPDSPSIVVEGPERVDTLDGDIYYRHDVARGVYYLYRDGFDFEGMNPDLADALRSLGFGNEYLGTFILGNQANHSLVTSPGSMTVSVEYDEATGQYSSTSGSAQYWLQVPDDHAADNDSDGDSEDDEGYRESDERDGYDEYGDEPCGRVEVDFDYDDGEREM